MEHITSDPIKAKDKAVYRIHSSDNRIMYTGGNSWMTLETAKELVDHSKGEMIYQWSDDYMNPLWEIL